VALCLTKHNYTEQIQRYTEFHREKQIEMEYKYQELTHQIIGCAMEVHKLLGPGLLESAYEECLAFELVNAGLYIERQKPVPVIYKEIKLECGYRIDILVENTVVIELKTVEAFNPVHEAQILTQMKFAIKPVGLLINFNVMLLKSGIKRFVI
jgi:GxxExxY protein